MAVPHIGNPASKKGSAAINEHIHCSAGSLDRRTLLRGRAFCFQRTLPILVVDHMSVISSPGSQLPCHALGYQSVSLFVAPKSPDLFANRHFSPPQVPDGCEVAPELHTMSIGSNVYFANVATPIDAQRKHSPKIPDPPVKGDRPLLHAHCTTRRGDKVKRKLATEEMMRRTDTVSRDLALLGIVSDAAPTIAQERSAVTSPPSRNCRKRSLIAAVFDELVNNDTPHARKVARPTYAYKRRERLHSALQRITNDS